MRFSLPKKKSPADAATDPTTGSEIPETPGSATDPNADSARLDTSAEMPAPARPRIGRQQIIALSTGAVVLVLAAGYLIYKQFLAPPPEPVVSAPPTLGARGPMNVAANNPARGGAHGNMPGRPGAPGGKNAIFNNRPAPAVPANAARPGAAGPMTGRPGTPGGPGMPGGPNANGKPMVIVSLPPNLAKRDPFYVRWHLRPPNPPSIFSDGAGALTAVAIVPISITPPEAAEAPSGPGAETPTITTPIVIKMSAFVSDERGGGVFAILDVDGNSSIVHAGSKLDNGFNVMSISERSTILRRKTENGIQTVTVPIGEAGVTVNP